jgi:TPR repeat protein
MNFINNLLPLIQENNVSQFLISFRKILIHSNTIGSYFSPYNFFKINLEKFPQFISSLTDFLYKIFNKNDSYHHFFLYLCLDTLPNKQANSQKAIFHLKCSAEMDNSFAICVLGDCYDVGYGVEQNINKAFQLYQRAANLNNSNAFFNLGVCYQNGDKVEQNFLKAFEYYKLAAQLEYPDAIFNLSIFFWIGKGVDKNFLKTFEFFNRVIMLNEDSEAYFYIFYLLSNGIGIERNISKSITFLSCSAKEGYIQSFVQYGLFLLNGTFIEKNEEKSVSYFKKSCQKHIKDGMFWYGFCLIEGKGIDQNFYFGKDFIERSLEKHFFLAELYYSSIEDRKYNYK